MLVDFKMMAAILILVFLIRLLLFVSKFLSLLLFTKAMES